MGLFSTWEQFLFNVDLIQVYAYLMQLTLSKWALFIVFVCLVVTGSKSPIDFFSHAATSKFL